MLADPYYSFDSIFSHLVSEMAGKAPGRGDTATHELIARFGTMEDERAFTSERMLGPAPNCDPPVGHLLECTNLGDKEYMAEKTTKAILGLIFGVVEKADVSH